MKKFYITLFALISIISCSIGTSELSSVGEYPFAKSRSNTSLDDLIGISNNRLKMMMTCENAVNNGFSQEIYNELSIAVDSANSYRDSLEKTGRQIDYDIPVLAAYNVLVYTSTYAPNPISSQEVNLPSLLCYPNRAQVQCTFTGNGLHILHLCYSGSYKHLEVYGSQNTLDDFYDISWPLHLEYTYPSYSFGPGICLWMIYGIMGSDLPE